MLSTQCSSTPHMAALAYAATMQWQQQGCGAPSQSGAAYGWRLSQSSSWHLHQPPFASQAQARELTKQGGPTRKRRPRPPSGRR